jgi:SAM-dependent methyltransferase
MTNSLSNTVENGSEAEAVVMTPSAFYANLFNRKVEQGIYATEKVNCFCGTDNSVPITNTDRYGIQYVLCLCVECGILYANPRMTEESFARFYKNDYRNIYSDVGDMLSRDGEDIPYLRTRDSVKRMMDEFELPDPKVIFDVGCGNGNLLAEFEGETVGVDYDENAVRAGQEKGRNLFHGGIDILESYGKKADLIILHHVLEHFLDLKRDLSRIRGLLSDDGVLYVSVPGFYTWDKNSLFQNAHTYQFTGNTLWYVMRCCGFEDLHLDENIESLWGKADPMEISNKNPQEARTIHQHLFGDKQLLPPIRVSCKFPLKERRENIRWILSSGIPMVTELINTHPDSTAVIVCGGPSVDGYEERIKELRDSGATVYAIERMYRWCLDREIIPDYVIAMDASDDVIESFHGTHPDVTHLLMCQCKPEVFQLLKDQGRKLFYFLVPQRGIPMGEYCREFGIESMSMINAVGSVSLGAFSLSMMLGARDIHMFGFDCHITAKDYAAGITGVGEIKDVLEVEINGKTFKTTPCYLAFMQHFFNLYSTGKGLGLVKSVRIYGDSLVSWASKDNISDREAIT